ncbi:MAG: methyltransferase domain-containing protein [Actinomycetota bacterium]|nr:methyltransferase domain-containing protein [Actinomycetota bacterium]
MSSSVETFEIPLEAAELYEEKFVPALFAEWAPLLVEAAGVRSGQSVLDVACGTGIAARAAADRLGGEGKVVGLDLNESMLTVARRLRSDIEWKQGDVAALPFSDGSFDVVLCQSALMFFPDPGSALREMQRVAAPRGTVAVQVYGTLESQPAYGPWVDLVARHAGPEAIDLLSTYFVHGALDALTALFEAAELEISAIRTHLARVRFDSIDQFVRTEVEATPLRERISDEIYERILEDSRELLSRYVTSDGLEGPIEGHLVTARTR